ncbi:MAG: MmcQ/YjbR family DNA-binding protein [Ilumatobacteraceae bacterium]
MARTDAQLVTQLEKIRALCKALPEVTEEVTWGTDVNFRVRKKIFCFPGSGGSITVKAERDELPALLADKRCSPARYLARGGWITMDLTAGKVSWKEIDELIRTSYSLIAPKTLVKLLG